MSDDSLDDVHSALRIATEDLEQFHAFLLQSKKDTTCTLEAELAEAWETVEQLKTALHIEEVERLKANLGRKVQKLEEILEATWCKV